jgi:hypothetical protein
MIDEKPNGRTRWKEAEKNFRSQVPRFPPLLVKELRRCLIEYEQVYEPTLKHLESDRRRFAHTANLGKRLLNEVKRSSIVQSEMEGFSISELERFVGRIEVLGQIKIVFAAYGYGNISHEGIKRYLRKERDAIKDPPRVYKRPQLVYLTNPGELTKHLPTAKSKVKPSLSNQ